MHEKRSGESRITVCQTLWGVKLKVQETQFPKICLKCRVVFGTVYGDMHLKDNLGSIARVGYCILVPDFYLVLHGIRC